jgi:hypothetical protein
VGKPWVFFLAPGWLDCPLQPIENRKIRDVVMGTESDLFSAGNGLAKKGNYLGHLIRFCAGLETARGLRNEHLIISSAIQRKGLTPDGLEP